MMSNQTKSHVSSQKVIGKRQLQKSQRLVSKKRSRERTNRDLHHLPQYHTQQQYREYNKTMVDTRKPLVRSQRRPLAFNRSMSIKRKNSNYSTGRIWSRQNHGQCRLFPLTALGKRKMTLPAPAFQQLKKNYTQSRNDLLNNRSVGNHTSMKSLKCKRSTSAKNSRERFQQIKCLTAKTSPLKKPETSVIDREVLKSVKQLRKQNFETK